MSHPEPELFDCPTLETLVATVGLSDTTNLVKLFFGEAAERVQTLRTLEVGQVKAVRSELHTLHGAAGMFGLVRFTNMLRAFHDDIASLSPEAYRRALDALDDVLLTSRTTLSACRERAG